MPILRIASYNIEWMVRLFLPDSDIPWHKQNTNPHAEARAAKSAYQSYIRSGKIARVIRAIEPDILGICEAPPTINHLQNWVDEFLADDGYRVIMAEDDFLSEGDQQLALLYRERTTRRDVSIKARVRHIRSAKRRPFKGKFVFDTDSDRIKEIYEFYRPPLEAEVRIEGIGKSTKIIVAHLKSKGIFNRMDMLHFEKESVRNRRKLFAETSWIRKRIEEYTKDKHPVIVMGDFNDGAGMDYYERKFGRSAAEIVMGSLWEPDKLLRNAIGEPRWGKYGWEPSTNRYHDSFTGDAVNALIDHILLSQDIELSKPGFVWNPYQPSSKEEITKIGGSVLADDLKDASDHYPISVDIALD